MKINENYWFVEKGACFLPNIILFKLKKSRKLPVGKMEDAQACLDFRATTC